VFFADVCGGFMQENFSAVSDYFVLPSQFPLASLNFAIIVHLKM
jgi:hypothetical protein